MTMIRALHQTCRAPDDDKELLAYTERARAHLGCLHAELYRSIEFPENVAVLEQFDSEASYDEHWNGLLDEGFSPDTLTTSTERRRYGEDGSEFYAYQLFDRGEGGYFIRADHPTKTPAIYWPNHAGVRIIILNSPANLADNLDRMAKNAKGTRAEAGCEHFEHFQGVEYAGHTCLIEWWTDEITYDAHLLFPRRPDGAPRPMETTPRIHGTNGLEFYRGQRFVAMFGHWAPIEIEARSTHLIWPA